MQPHLRFGVERGEERAVGDRPGEGGSRSKPRRAVQPIDSALITRPRAGIRLQRTERMLHDG